jgi:hypothetical protein
MGLNARDALERGGIPCAQRCKIHVETISGRREATLQVKIQETSNAKDSQHAQIDLLWILFCTHVPRFCGGIAYPGGRVEASTISSAFLTSNSSVL